jgi:flagellar biosynthetic protein FliQ
MSPDLILSMGQKMLELAFILAAPVLLVTFLVGLIVSILQSATQIQEMTLSYIPAVAEVIAFVLSRRRRIVV